MPPPADDDAHATSRARWAAAVAPTPLELVNPPETLRTYSDFWDGSARSVLGSLGEWKVASHDRSRWLTLSLGGLRQVHAIVLQSGSLRDSFSGWVQQLRVAYSCAEEMPRPAPSAEAADETEAADELRGALAAAGSAAEHGWVDLGRDLLTGARSDPLMEHCVWLREPIYMRHVRLTPTKWRVAGALATGEDLTPKISMRVAVLAAAGARAPEDGSTLRTARRECPLRPAELRCLLNLRTPAAVRVEGGAPLARRLAGAVYLTAAREGGEGRRVVGRLHPACELGDCVSLPGGEEGVVHGVDEDGVCAVAVEAEGGATRRLMQRPLAVLGRKELPSSSTGYAYHPMKAEARLQLADEWLDEAAWGHADGTCALEVEGEEGVAAALRVRPTEVAYACSEGTRLSLTSRHRHREACGTVVHVYADGTVALSVDNTRGLAAFKRWAVLHHGKESRGILYPVVVDPRPSSVVLGPSIRHAAGTRLLVLHRGALIDVTVDVWLGVAHGNLHRLVASGTGEVLLVDLNEFNHTVQRFDSAASFERVRREYCALLTQRGQLVEDAVTGHKLRIEEQLLNISMATGHSAVALDSDALAGLPADALVWRRGAELQPGDRVRCDGRLGSIGWTNDEGVLTRRGKKRLHCGRGHARGVCDGVAAACDSCARLAAAVEAELGEENNWRLHHVQFDEGTPRRALRLAHEVERASAICGVHVKEWNGATFHSGDVVVVHDGCVTHRASQKRVPLAHAYRPLLLSPLPNARTSTIELVRGNGARRVHGRGGAVISAEPLVAQHGKVVFEVVVKKYAGAGNEGLEIGVTTTPPERVDMNAINEYCAMVHPSWISSDSGSLWVNGRPKYDQGQWSTTRPVNLKAGDVVQLTVHASGALEVHCNGEFQVVWHAARIPVHQPLYAIIGMRAPAVACSLRQRDEELSQLPGGARVIALRGIEGREGEMIDLSKHGHPKYPAAFWNIRSISDIRSLYPLLLGVGPRRPYGRGDAQPILVRAAPGTGKTWCIMQLLFYLARGTDALPLAQKWAAAAQGLPLRARYAGAGAAPHATRLRLTPYVIYVQKLARLMRQFAAATGGVPRTDLVRFYMAAERSEGMLDAPTVEMLEQLHEARALILLIDGVDEAADLAHLVEDFVTRHLVPEGHPLVVTSRPEGVRLRLYAEDFVIINLEPLTKEQQQAAIDMQLQDSPFFTLLSKFSAIRRRQDEIYATDAFPMAADRAAIEGWKFPNLYRIGDGLGFDPSMRARDAHDALVRRRDRGAPPRSRLLTRLGSVLSHGVLEAIDAALAATTGALGDGEPPAGVEVRLAERLQQELPAGSSAEQLHEAVSLAGLMARRAAAGEGVGSASCVWEDIVAGTDAIYETAELAKPFFEMIVRKACALSNVDPDAMMGATTVLRVDDLKHPVRLCEKAREYAQRFNDGVPAEACVDDVLRARLVFTKADAFVKLATALRNGVRHDAEGAAVRLELIRGVNRFMHCEPTHFRHLVFNLCLSISHADGRRARVFCEMELHHLLLLQHHQACRAKEHYRLFGAHLHGNYERVLSDDLDFILEKRMVIFDEVGKTPVLLSMLILVLGSHGANSGAMQLPSDIYELYSFAIDAALARQLQPAQRPTALLMLRVIATANHMAKRRTFSLSDAREALRPHPEALSLWEYLASSSAIPLVKTLALGEQMGEFQFKHLSLQEALFCTAIVNGEAPQFWCTDAVAAANLGTPLYKNTFAIGTGYLGEGLSQQRPSWDFEQHRLSERGWAALQQLLPGSSNLVSLKLPLHRSLSALEVTTSADGPRPFFKTKLPSTLCRSFRAARVEGLTSLEQLRVRREAEHQQNELSASDTEWAPLRIEAVKASSLVGLSVAELKAILRQQDVDITGVVEKADLIRLATDSAPRTGWLPSGWFSHDIPTDSLAIGVVPAVDDDAPGAKVAVDSVAYLALDKGEETRTLLAALELCDGALSPDGTPRVDDALIARLLSKTAAGGSRWAALVRHAGAWRCVASLLRLAPEALGEEALRATLAPGLAHLAQRLLALTVAPAADAKCLTDAQLARVAESLVGAPAAEGGAETSAWHALALDGSAASAAVVDEMLARVPALEPTIAPLMYRALSQIECANVALRLATKYWKGPIDVAQLRRPVAQCDGGGGWANSLWFTLALNAQSAPLAEHLFERLPELEETTIPLFVEAAKQHNFDAIGRLVRRGVQSHPRFSEEVVPMLLEKRSPLPCDLFKPLGNGPAGRPAVELEESEFFQKLSPRHMAHFTSLHSLWTLLVLDESKRAVVDDIAAAQLELSRARLHPEVLLLALVPQQAALAYQLLADGARMDDATLTTILEPANDGKTAWQRLQLDSNSRRLVNKLMLTVPALSSLDVFLCVEHAARASDLLAAGVPLGLPTVRLLLQSQCSDAVLSTMTYEQAASTPGAIVHDSPHPYPNDADIRETFSIPGASSIWVAFHESTFTERGYDPLRFSWAGGQKSSDSFSGTSFPGMNNTPPLRIEGDSFEIRFRSGEGDSAWGYRFVAWSEGPAGWCRFAELMLSESKECDRLCRDLMARSPELTEFGRTTMVELALKSAATNPKNAPAAVGVLRRSAGRPSASIQDLLLTPGADGQSPWYKLLTENAAPQLTDMLIREPRLLAAARQPEVLLATLHPKRTAAAMKLLQHVVAVPDLVCTALLEREAPSAPSQWEKLVRDESCGRVVEHLLREAPRLTQPALLSALVPGYTFFYHVLADRFDVFVDEATVDALLQERAGVGGNLWTHLLLHGPWPFVCDLMSKHARLREAALQHHSLVSAMSSPLTTAVACRLIEMGALADQRVEQSLAAPLDGVVDERYALRQGTEVLQVRGLPRGHPMERIQGLYTSAPEEVRRRGISFINAKQESEAGSKRRIYRQVGGDFCLWFRIFDATDDGVEEVADSRSADAEKLADRVVDEDDLDSDDEEDEPEHEGNDEEDEEPEEQEGEWLITLNEFVGVKHLETKQIMAMVSDNTLSPHAVVSEVWSVLVREGHSKRVEVSSFGVHTANNLSSSFVKASSSTPSLWSALVSSDACSTLVDLLLCHAPHMGPDALLAALQSDGTDVYERLVERTQLNMNDGIIERLLAPRGDSTSWQSILLQPKTRPSVIEQLIDEHEQLKIATLSQEMLIAALTPQTVPVAMWMIGRGAKLDATVERALLEVDQTPKMPQWVLKLPVDEHLAPVPFQGRYVLTERVVSGRPVYEHIEKEFAIWFSGEHSLWFVTLKAKTASRIASMRSLVALNRSNGMNIEQMDPAWAIFPGGTMQNVSISRMPTVTTALEGLLFNQQCAPLIDLLLQELPSLRPTALRVALEAEGGYSYWRLLEHGLISLTDELVDTLLEPRDDGGSLWRSIVLQDSKRPMVDNLLRTTAHQNERLQQATQAIVAEAAEVEGEPNDMMENESMTSDQAAEEEMDEEDDLEGSGMSEFSDQEEAGYADMDP